MLEMQFLGRTYVKYESHHDVFAEKNLDEKGGKYVGMTEEREKMLNPVPFNIEVLY